MGPVNTKLAPGFARRSFAASVSHCSSKLDSLAAVCTFPTTAPRPASFVPPRIFCASACVNAAIWLTGQRSRWSAIAPVSVKRFSTTYSRFMLSFEEFTLRREVNARTDSRSPCPQSRKSLSKARITSARSNFGISRAPGPNAFCVAVVCS